MRFLLGLALALSTVVLRAEIPPLLDEAWSKYVQDIDRWAYTETTQAFDAKGKPTRETVTRYDPSLPYPEQFTVLSHKGKTPLEQMQKWARLRGEDRGKYLERPGGVENDARPRITLNGSPALADLEHATVVEETAQSIAYEVRLHAEGGKASMVENFRTHVRVSKTTHGFEQVDIKLPAPQRINVFVKLNEIDIAISFATVEPQFSPVGTVFKEHSAASAFFRKREGGHESTRTDFKRVKPYRERFGVKFGTLRTIDF